MSQTIGVNGFLAFSKWHRHTKDTSTLQWKEIFCQVKAEEWSYKNTLRVSLRRQEDLQVLCHLLQLWPRESLWGLFTSSSLNMHHHHFIFIIPILGTIKWKQIAVAMKQIMRGSDGDSSPRAGRTATRCQAILNVCLCSCPPLTKSYKRATLHPVIIIIILTIPYPSYFPCYICTRVCVWLCFFICLFIYFYLVFLCFGDKILLCSPNRLQIHDSPASIPNLHSFLNALPHIL